MFLARADREFRALVVEVGGEAPAAKHVGLGLDGLTAAAEARSERLFWVVTDPNQQPGPSTLAAIGGAWFHGAMCAAVARIWEAPVPSCLVGTADLMVAVLAYEAECDVTGNSMAALARRGMVRGQLQPEFSALAPPRAVHAVCSEMNVSAEMSRDMLGLFAVDGAAVARTALEHVASDPSPRQRPSRRRSRPTSCTAPPWNSCNSILTLSASSLTRTDPALWTPGAPQGAAVAAARRGVLPLSGLYLGCTLSQRGSAKGAI